MSILVSLWLSWRYLCARQSHRFISLTALSSGIGLALGIAVLITVLSVMNGFDLETRQRMFRLIRPVSVVVPSNESFKTASAVVRDAADNSTEIEAAAPAIVSQGMVTYKGLSSGVILQGVNPAVEPQLLQLDKLLVSGSWKGFSGGEFNVLIGAGLAQRLGASVGSEVMLVVPNSQFTPLGVTPRFKRFKVAGVFYTGDGFNHDDLVVFTTLSALGKLIQHPSPNRWHLKLKDIYKAPLIKHQLNLALASRQVAAFASDWTEDYGAFFRAVKMEKSALFLLLVLIVAVASFNLVAGLSVMVAQKRREIAMLRALGLNSSSVVLVFIFYGAIVGAVAAVLGTGLGLVISWQAPHLVNMLERLLGQQLFTSEVYLMNSLPVHVLWTDVITVNAASFIMSVLATIYPAFKASKILPAEGLSYEV